MKDKGFGWGLLSGAILGAIAACLTMYILVRILMG